MLQSDLFALHNIPPIPGLRYLPAFITPAEEQALIAQIDAQSWITEIKRRTQHYGYRYRYKARDKVAAEVNLGPLPEWILPLAERLVREGYFSDRPDQSIVNEYLPGQGIAPHTDRLHFTDTIASLSLNSACVMNFLDTETGDKQALLLEPCSLLILTGPARYRWQHGIAPRKTDRYHGTIIPRGRRLSLTFRKHV